MKLSALFLLLVVCLTASADTPKPIPTDWLPVIGAKSLSGVLYYDKNTLHRETTSEHDFSVGTMLLVYSGNEDPDSHPKGARSLVRRFVMDCKAGYSMPVIEFYFSVALPKRSDSPIAGKSYDADPDNRRSEGKESLLKQTLCPDWV